LGRKARAGSIPASGTSLRIKGSSGLASSEKSGGAEEVVFYGSAGQT